MNLAHRHPVRHAVVLVDVIVGAVLLGIALAVMLGILGRSITAQSRGEELQTAAALLDEQLNLVLMRGPDNYAGRFPVEGPCDAPFQAYSYRLSFKSAAPGLAYEVTATVSWNSGGRVQSADASTLIAPRLGDDPDPLRTPDQVVERQP